MVVVLGVTWGFFPTIGDGVAAQGLVDAAVGHGTMRRHALCRRNLAPSSLVVLLLAIPCDLLAKSSPYSLGLLHLILLYV